MDRTRVAIATVTWVRSPDEEIRLRRSLRRLSDLGLPIAIADRDTSATFAAFLRTLRGVSIADGRAEALVPQIHDSFALAATFHRPFILYSEPDKEFFFQERLGDFVRSIPDEHDVGIAIASRSAASLRTFPPMQRYTEGIINTLCAEVIGIEGDYSYGPFLLNHALLPQLMRLDQSIGWGWRHALFLEARPAGLRILHRSDHYPCPFDERIEEDVERRHRLRQLSQNVLGLINGSTSTKNALAI